MLKPRLRAPLAAGLLRASPASARFSPFGRAATVAPRRQSLAYVQLDSEETFKQEGIYKLYTREGFDFAWNQYQEWCTDMLNQEIAGTDLENMTPLRIANITSREASAATIFNYASMAHNNHFFFKTIASNYLMNKDGEYIDTPPYHNMPAELRTEIETQFGSLDNLRLEMLGQAQAMFGPGFVWLVRVLNLRQNLSSPFRVLSTYQAGSPYPEAHWRRQANDMNTVGGLTESVGGIVENYFAMIKRANIGDPEPSLQQGSQSHRPPNWAHIVPVLCVNTWEHAWIPDYGIRHKRHYLECWWKAINWEKVSENSRPEKHKMDSDPGMFRSDPEEAPSNRPELYPQPPE